MKNYTVIHLHDDRSNCNGYADSTTNYKDYIKLAKDNGMKAIAFTNHGGIFDWVKSKMDCDKAGIKYIHATELYLCTTLDADERGYHICLYAKNLDGVKELNALYSLSTSKGIAEDKSDRHFYYNPRISISELMQTSDNIIITTACLASILWQEKSNEVITPLLNWFKLNSHRVFLEIQYHNYHEQKEYNKLLYKWSEEYNLKLIVGTDTHSASAYKADCRKILQKSKGSYYGQEDEFDLVWKTYAELVKLFQIQASLPKEIYLEAIENTNYFADLIEDFTLDKSFKYPNLYGANANELWKKLINKKYKDKCNNNAIDKNDENYIKHIKEEFEAMSKQGMESFMLFMAELVEYCNNNNIPYGFCRGSVGGSVIAYITDIIDVDPIIWNTVFSRFCNADRISLADIDMDFAPEDRDKVYKWIFNKFSSSKTAFIAQFGTLKDRGAIDTIARGLGFLNLDIVMQIKNEYDAIFKAYAKIIAEEINIEELDYEYRNIDFDHHELYRNKLNSQYKNVALNSLDESKHKFEVLKDDYPEIFRYFDGLKGTIISKGNHPAGIIGSPITLPDNLGVFYKDGDLQTPVAVCSMKPIDILNYVKFDILGLKTVGIMKDVYNYINSSYLKSYEIDWGDFNVWEDMTVSKVGVFQFEGESGYAFDLLKEFKPSKINDMSIVNAALRPSGKSYRDRLIKKEFNKNPSKQIDELLKENYGYLVYQEDTIKFLTDICGFDGSLADTTRRCVNEDTLIMMANGDYKPIKNVEEDDYVQSFNTYNISEYKKVLNVFNNGVKNSVKITTKHDYEIFVTDNHKLLTQRGWVESKDLNLDDFIMTPKKINAQKDDLVSSYRLLFADYMPVRIKSIEKSKTCNMYDIEVEDNHNYVANGLIVHNCIGKKDVRGLNEQLPKILEGYCKKSDKPRKIAEEEARQFIKIIEDSSEYQFGYNHSTGYSMNGYACVRLRHYYPLEFTTAYLNRANNEADLKDGMELAKQRKIIINPIKFRYSYNKYMFDKKTNSIYKGLSSVKGIGEKKDFAQQLLMLKLIKYKHFVDLLVNIKEQTDLDSSQITSLIELDFFSEFGDANYLLKVYLNFKSLYERKNLHKEKLIELELTEEIVKKHCEKETEKLFKNVDVISLIKELPLKYCKRTPVEKLVAEHKFYNYMYSVFEIESNYVIIIDINTDYTPKVKCYSLSTGEEKTYKIYKETFFTKPTVEKPQPVQILNLYDVVKIGKVYERDACRKVGEEWIATGEKDLILKSFKIVQKYGDI